MANFGDFIFLIPELFLMCAITTFTVWPLAVSRLTSLVDRSPVIHNGTRHLLLFTFVSLLLLIFNSFFYFSVFNFQLLGNYSLATAKILTVIFAFGLLTFSTEKVAYEFYVLILVSILGLFVFLSSTDFLTFYLALELQSFAAYILAASNRYSTLSAEAGIKYFVLGAVASAFILFGIGLLYGAYGTINFIDLELLWPEHSFLVTLLGLTFLLAGLFFKLGLAPFHIWLADVYEGAPRPAVAFFALIPKFAIFIVLFRVLLLFLSHFDFWSGVIYVIAYLSLILGTFAGLAQSSVLRLVAFSSVANLGIAVFPLITGNLVGFHAALSYLLIYVLLSFIFLSFSLLLKHKEGSY